MQQPVPTVVIVGLLSVSVACVLETEAVFLFFHSTPLEVRPQSWSVEGLLEFFL